MEQQPDQPPISEDKEVAEGLKAVGLTICGKCGQQTNLAKSIRGICLRCFVEQEMVAHQMRILLQDYKHAAYAWIFVGALVYLLVKLVTNQ